MKKRLFSILAIATLTTTTWADISTEQLNTYMKASGTDVVLEKMQTQLATSIEMKAKMRGQEIPADVLKEINTIASNKNNLELFTKGIKSLDEKDYKEIIKFYDTKLGKKNADLIRNMNSLTMQQEIAKFSTKELSKERKKLIPQLVDASMSEKKAEKIGKVMIQTTLDALPKEMRVKFQEKMDAQMPQIKLKMREETEKATAYLYQDYSDAELKLLINHFETPFAQKESEALIDGLTEYMKVVMSQMMEVMKKKHDESKKKVVCSDLNILYTELMLFRLDNGINPTTEEGLEALLKNPNPKKYPHYSAKSYADKITLDPWGSKFIYRNNNGKIELLSYGADKKAGGDNENSDISLSDCK